MDKSKENCVAGPVKVNRIIVISATFRKPKWRLVLDLEFFPPSLWIVTLEASATFLEELVPFLGISYHVVDGHLIFCSALSSS